jgi:hypothetical protein
MTKAYTPSFGSISCGTMLPEDLIPAFEYELNLCNTDHPLLKEIDKLEDYKSEEADEILQELFDALNEYAPAYGYFGSHPGDGADYGFWLSETIEEDFDGLKVDDTSEVPSDYSGEVLHVNDHGNCTLYVADHGKLTEVWAVV